MIEPFSESDLQAVVNIYNATKMDELVNEVRPFKLIPLKQDAKRYKSIFSHSINVYRKENIQGFIAFDETHINGLFVLPQYRGQGIGRSLIHNAIQQMGREVHLQVVKSNSSAIQLYLSMGFKVKGEFIAEYNQQDVCVLKMQYHD